MDARVSSPPGNNEGSGRRKTKSASNSSKTLIARNLKTVYGQVASEAVPQYLLDILKPLDDEEKKS